MKHGVSIIGYTDLPSRLAAQSSQLYATNLRHLLTDLTPEKDGKIVVDMEDEVVRGATVCRDGETTWPPPAPKLSAAPPKASRNRRRWLSRRRTSVAGPSLAWPSPACLAGSRRSRAAVVHGALHRVRAGLLRRLHGDLERSPALAHAADERHQCDIEHHRHRRSDSNQFGERADQVDRRRTLLITSINIAGGFAVTRRMLEMFRK